MGGANLGGANLGEATSAARNLGGANLGGNNLGGSNLGGNNLGGSNLGGNNLGGSNLGGSNLGGANLGGSNLGGANLGGSNLGGSNLGGSNLGVLAIPRNEKPYVSILRKEADTTFAHATNILSDFEAKGLVEFVSEGRMKYVRLTKRGSEVLKSLQSLDSALGGGAGQGPEAPGAAGQPRRRAAEDGRVRRPDGKNGPLSRWTIAAATAAIEAEAVLFGNDRLDYEIKVMKERLD